MHGRQLSAECDDDGGDECSPNLAHASEQGSSDPRRRGERNVRDRSTWPKSIMELFPITSLYIGYQSQLRYMCWTSAGRRKTGLYTGPSVEHVPPPCGALFLIHLETYYNVELTTDDES